MKIEKNKMVSIHYTLKDDDGKVIDSSVGSEPLTYLHGNGYLILGLENELEGKEEGDKFSCKIAPKDGYGEYDSRLVSFVNKDQFETDVELEVGMQFQVMTYEGVKIITIKEICDDGKVKVDGNHELAGKNLNFDVEVVTVRDATEDELNPQGCGCGCGGDCGDGCGGGCGDGGCCGGCN